MNDGGTAGVQQQLHLQTDPLASILQGQRPWIQLEIRNEQNHDYMPDIGYTAAFEPKPKTPTSVGNVLACAAEMGRGKSCMIRNYQRKTIEGQVDALLARAYHNPSARFLLLTANRLYAASAAGEQEDLAATLRAAGFKSVVVGLYSDESVNLDAAQFVLCSLESLHRVDGQRFDVVVIDEVGSIARLVGGRTMTELSNVFLLSDICSKIGTRVVALDADLLFKMDPSEPNNVVHDFFKLVMPEREVICAKLSDPKPAHLQRVVRLYFDCKACEGRAGKGEWWAGVETLVHRWHETGGDSGMVVVVVGTKGVGREVCRRLANLKAPFRFYHGDSNQRERFVDFSNPLEAWRGVCVVVCTTVMSIGIDIPREIMVAQVFAAFCRMGCSFQQLCQALLRPRHVRNAEMRVLFDCMPPNVMDALVAEGKKKVIVRPTYDDVMKVIERRRVAGLRLYERALVAIGGLPAGVERLKKLGDDAVRTMAHASLERRMQMIDPCYAAFRLFTHHGWDTQLGLAGQAAATADLSALPDPILSEDAEFDVLKTTLEKWTWVVKQIFDRGEAGFFMGCYGLATRTKASSNSLSSGDQWLVKAYWALKNVDYVPGTDADQEGVADDGEGAGVEDAPAAAVLLKKWLGTGSDHQNMTPHLQLHAFCRILTPIDAMRRDVSETLSHGKRKRDPQLELDLGMKLQSVAQLGKLLLGDGYRLPCQLVEERVDLQRLVDVANRFVLSETTDADRIVLAHLRSFKTNLSIGGKGTTALDLLRAVAMAMGMKLVPEMHQPLQPDGSRPHLVKSMHLERLFPEVSDDLLVWSNRLGKHVRVADWGSAHANVQLDAVQRAYSSDRDYGSTFTAPFDGDTDDMRWEKINDAELQAELTRLRRVCNTVNRQTPARPIEQDQRKLGVLEAMNANAEPVGADGIRRLCVVYGKRKGIGRRTASYPSMQSCVGGLRPLLQRFYCHDIDIVNCHPTLMVQIAEKMGRASEIPTLLLYVRSRDKVLGRIAAHFGAQQSICKFAVLRVLNGGSVQEWCKDVGLPSDADVDQPDLRDLAEEARVVRDAFFAMVDRKYPAGTLRSLREVVRASKGTEASNAAVSRAVFSHCIFEVEDRVLDAVDESLRCQGWVVSSLIYDGMHVEHRRGDTCDPSTGRWTQLEAAMRAAETAASVETGYKIRLVEKPLFDAAAAETVSAVGVGVGGGGGGGGGDGRGGG